MKLFKKDKKATVPPECLGMEVRRESSVCTGETVIGFYDEKSRKLLYAELCESEKDIEKFYKRYGIDPKTGEGK